MIKAIIFDCFGVLATDGWTPFKAQHIEPNSELERTIAAIGRQSDIGKLSAAETTHQMADLIGVGEEVLRAALSGKVPNEKLFSYIETELKLRYKIGLMSNANYDVTKELFSSNQMALFDTVVLSYNTYLAKPDRAMFELVAGKLGLQLSECLFIDDKQQYVDAAKQYGAPSLFYTSFDKFKADLTPVLGQNDT